MLSKEEAKLLLHASKLSAVRSADRGGNDCPGLYAAASRWRGAATEMAYFTVQSDITDIAVCRIHAPILQIQGGGVHFRFH